MKFASIVGKKGLSLDRLAALVEVDDAGGIASAAPDDDVRQGLICRQLAQLEKFFQVELKNKTGRTILLTPAGKQLASIAREHLQSLEEFQRACHQQPAEVVIGAGDSLLQWLLLPRISKVRAALQGSVVELRDMQNKAICDALRDHLIDFGLVRSDLVLRKKNPKRKNLNRKNPERFTLDGVSLGKFGYSLFIPDKLYPREKNADEAQLLQQLPLATQGGSTLFQRRLEELAASRNWKLNVNLRCESFPQAAQVLASGQMAVILPDLARLGAALDSVRVYPLKSLDELGREVYLAWHPHRLDTRPHLAGVRNELSKVLKFAF